MKRRTGAGRIGMATLAALLALGVPAAASAQMSDGYKFLESVRKGDGDAVTRVVETPGSTLINTRDRTTGETALLICMARRDSTYVRYLLGHGARWDIATNDGRTPLMIAVEKKFADGIDALIAAGVNINQTNGRGETALIRAVQLQDVATVRTLIAHGADPNKRDTLAGMSAKDYAQRDARVPGMMEALDAAKPTPERKAVQGPSL